MLPAPPPGLKWLLLPSGHDYDTLGLFDKRARVDGYIAIMPGKERKIARPVVNADVIRPRSLARTASQLLKEHEAMTSRQRLRDAINKGDW